MLCRTLDRAGLKDYRVGLGDASLFGSLMEGLEVPVGVRETLLDALGRRDFVAVERCLAMPTCRPARAPACWRCRSCEAAPRCWGTLRDRWPTPCAACAKWRAARAGRRRSRDLRPRAAAQHRLLHRSGVRGLRPGARGPARRRRPLRRSARALRARRCRPSALRSASKGCTSPSPARSAARGRCSDERHRCRRDAG